MLGRGKETSVSTTDVPGVEQARAEDTEGSGSRVLSDADLDRELVLADLLVSWDLELLHLRRRLEDLTLTIEEERELLADLERVATEREDAKRKAVEELDTGRIVVAEVMARSPRLQALRARHRYFELAGAGKESAQP